MLKKDSDFQNTEDDGQTFFRRKPFRYIHYFSETELAGIFEDNGLTVLDSTEFEERTGNLLRSKETSFNRYWLFFCEKLTT